MTGALSAVGLAEVRAALAAGASPSAALVAGFRGQGPLETVVRDVRVGRTLREAVGALEDADPTAALLVRALAVAEETGAGAAVAVDQALAAAAEEALVARLLRSRTAQARGTAVMLALLPALGWTGAVAAGAGVAFLVTPLGRVTAGLAVALGGLGALWSRRIIRGASSAAARVDPLGATETVELVGVALAAGLSVAGAAAAVAPLAPPAAREILTGAARRLGSGWTPGESLAGTPLEALGQVLDATQRWGAPAGPALAALAADLRAQRRAAAEEAAERAQLLLIFPTTLLTLPSFVLAVVPPLLWAAFAGLRAA